MKIAVCNEFFEGWPIERVFEYAGEIGCDGVEIAPFTLARSVTEISPGRRREIRRAAEGAGVEVVGLHWLLVSPEGLYVNHPDDGIRRATQDYLCVLIRFCGDIGGTVMVVGSPKQRSVQEGWDRQATWDRTVGVFRACLPVAEGYGVTLCIEALSAAQTNFITRAEEARRIVEEIAHPYFQTMFDVCSGSTEERPIPEIIRGIAPYLRHFHANDANGRGPGFGEVDFRPILRTLAEVGYDRYLSVEVFDFKPDPETIATRSLAYLKEILEGK